MQVNKIVVCGAGTMGSGIAQVAAQAGYNVVQYDLLDLMLDKSRKAIANGLEKMVQKSKITAANRDKIWDRILFTSDLNVCIGDVIIEAVVEKLEVKTKLFQDLERINNSAVIFATNTSSLPVSAIAKELQHPEQVAGMHFFNPAPLMKLVEVVETPYTSANTVQTLLTLAADMQKVPVLCKDIPGFIVNRVARPYYLEAMRLLEKKLVSNPDQIDNLMEAIGFKMGPFRLMDLIGMDVNYAVSDIVWQALGKPDRLQPSPIQKEKVDTGFLGRKTGAGFYQY